MNWHGTAAEILALAQQAAPGVDDALARARGIAPYYKREISEYQAAALYAIATRFNRPGARILEIGTAWGYSAAVMALAAPQAAITTLFRSFSRI